MIKRLTVLVLFLSGFTISCKERFDPRLSPTQSNYLVVEGYINAQGVSTITLSRSVPITQNGGIKPEPGAQITIEGQDNSTFPVKEIGNGTGTYKSNSLSLALNQKYRLHIKTTTNGEYLSTFSDVRTTPAIDSISWKNEDAGIRIYANTHDQTNNTRYYKWDYEETWEINSTYASLVQYLNGNIFRRDVSEIEKFYRCWRYENSTRVLLGSSAQLVSDVISEAPLTFVNYESEKTSVRYSLLVKQYSLDRRAYDFYKMMKTNTETIGSVFDPLPSELTGNLACVSNPAEKVIGFVSVSTMSEKRIFITRSQFPSKYRANCYEVYVVNNPDSIKYYFGDGGGGLMPFESDGSAPAPIKGYYGAPPTCVDCNLRGSNIKPTYW